MGIFFNGKWVERPQAVARVDVRGMVPPNLVAEGIGYLIGKSTGGRPQEVMYFSDLSSAREELISGDLLDACEIAFNPSSSAGIGGAGILAVVRVEPATQSLLTLKDNDTPGVDVITVKSKGYGSYTTGISMKIEAGTSIGIKVTINYGNLYEVGDNIGNASSQVDAFVDWINNNSQLVTAEKTAVGTDILAQIAYTNLSGGTTPDPTAQDWQLCIDKLKVERVNIGTVLTDDASVHAMLDAHCVEMSAFGKMSRRAIVGGAKGETVQDVLARALALSSQYTAIVYPGIDRYVNGELKKLSSVYSAVSLVGMACNVAVNMPLTFKYVKAVGLEKVCDQTELDQLHAGRVIALENVPRKGIRIVDDVMTTIDLRYGNLHLVRIYDWLCVNMTAYVEDYHVGNPGDQYAPAAIKGGLTSVVLMPAKNNGYIHPGFDDNGTWQEAFRNLTIIQNGQYWTVNVDISPTEQIGYVPITINAKQTSQAA